jgi:hypothetical protein
VFSNAGRMGDFFFFFLKKRMGDFVISVMRCEGIRGKKIGTEARAGHVCTAP